jgi:tetratricopeptide (TPR) repeat protein
MYHAVVSSMKRGRTADTEKLAYRFLKRYPLNSHVPDVRLILAEVEEDWKKSVSKYRVVIDKYRYYPGRDLALFRICEIYSLRSEWNNLGRASLEGMRKFGKSRYLDEFRIFYLISLVNTGQLEKARDFSLRTMKESNRESTLSRTLILYSFINRKMNGLSRSYIYNLREILIGYQDSYSYPTAIYFMGRFYEKKGDWNRAWSAYMDLRKKFPRSMESLYAEKRIDILKKYRPRRVHYIPGNRLIEKTENLDISPNIDINDREKSGISGKGHYTVAVGPLSSLRILKQLKRELKGFGPSTSVRMRNGYTLFIGNYYSPEGASRTRIRLAEEYGIKGRIMRVSGSGSRKYLYED